MKPLALQQVTLTQFRNYTSAQFSFGPRFNLISGLNGVGKTNLLDAVYYLSVGKSYFTPYDQRIVSLGEGAFRLEAHLIKDGQSHTVIIKVRPGQAKEIIVDHLPLDRISDHLGFLPIVFSAPRDIDLVTGSSQARRKYFDHLLCQLDHLYLNSLMQYNHLLLLRNAALKNELADLHRLIQTYDEQMAIHAQVVFEKRKWLTKTITPILQETYSILSDDREKIDCIYESQLLENRYEVLADRYWEADKNQQRSNAGIHKDDFEFLIKEKPAKEFGSQGQIKSLIFSMHLSKYALLREGKGVYPILVLDDIFDKLDERRLSRLMELLTSNDFGQIFISDTNAHRLRGNLPQDMINEIELE